MSRPVAGHAWGIVGIILVILLVVSLILSAFFCAFPWSMTTPRAHAQTTPQRDPMTLIYAVDDSTEARRQIEAGHAKLLEAWKTGNATLLASLYALDGAILEPGRPPVTGREAILQRMEEIFARDRMTEGTIATQDVFVLGEHAFATGTWKFSIGPKGKKARSRSGRFVDIWVREGVGRWMKWRDVGIPK